jgi:hypothetical protein
MHLFDKKVRAQASKDQFKFPIYRDKAYLKKVTQVKRIE